jgi:hypothetical protein
VVLNYPVASPQRMLDLRKEHGRKNDRTGLCIDEGMHCLGQDMAKIIQKDRVKLEKEFELTLPGVTGIGTRARSLTSF